MLLIESQKYQKFLTSLPIGRAEVEEGLSSPVPKKSRKIDNRQKVANIVEVHRFQRLK